MANTSSAKKEIRVNRSRALRNKSVRSASRTSVNRAEGLIFSAEMEPARAAVKTAASTLDRAVRKGVIHPNNAARHKSRLMKKQNALESSGKAAKA